MARYAIIENGNVAVYPASKRDLKARNPNTSFPRDLTSADLSDFGWTWVDSVNPPTYDPDTEYIIEITPEFINGTWTQRWDVRSHHHYRLSEIRLEREQQVRDARLGLLILSDAVVLSFLEKGNPVPQDYQDYRDALRGITDQAGFPYNVTWPTEPTY